jgi:chromosome partitioning protein
MLSVLFLLLMIISRGEFMLEYSIRRISKLFGKEIPRATLIKAESTGAIPGARRKKTGAIRKRFWTNEDIPVIGERYGFMKKPTEPTCITVFTTKGGAFKTTTALNLARMAALHNIKTCIVGLDLQGDITNAVLGDDDEEVEDLDAALEDMKSQVTGLYSFHRDKRAKIEDLLVNTDIPTLKIIPEDSSLALLEREVGQINRREYWLKEKVVAQLKKKFDLIILDCSPNWNHLISNAIAACDVLLSPVECKINHFRNLEVFREILEEFKHTMKLSYKHVYVPTKFTSRRKLCNEIRQWYTKNLPNVTLLVIRESAQGEDATASRLSIPEFSPSELVADEMRELIANIWSYVEQGPKSTETFTSRKVQKSISEGAAA